MIVRNSGDAPTRAPSSAHTGSLSLTDSGEISYAPKQILSARRRTGEGERMRFLGSLFLLDCILIALCFSVAGAIRLGSPIEEPGIRTLAVVLPMFIVIALNNQSYSLDALTRPTFGASRAVQALVYACVVALAMLFYLKVSDQFSRLVFGIGTVSSVIAIAGLRTLYGNYLGAKHRWTFRNRLVIVDEVKFTPNPGDTIVYSEQLGIRPGDDDPALRHRLGEMLDRFDSVVLACPPSRRRGWSYSLKGSSVDVELLMPELSRFGAVALRRVHGENTLVVSSQPLVLRDRLLKRALDLTISSCAVLILAPVMAVLAILIKFDSPGPVLFRQARVGQNNRMFDVLKFRSMHIEFSDPSGSRSTSKLDDRVTGVGRVMRRMSLDELPQLFNVISGDMSIVGPRPHALGSTAERALFWQIDRRYFERHSIKPGMTGLAQVRGFRGATELRADLTNRLDSDLEYVAGWTIWRDIKIIATTFLVLIHPNAF